MYGVGDDKIGWNVPGIKAAEISAISSVLYRAPILQHMYPIRWTGTQHADELQLRIIRQLSVLLFVYLVTP